jgi:hypothetical protein
MNMVQDEVRTLFFERNPDVAKAWGVDINQ